MITIEEILTTAKSRRERKRPDHKHTLQETTFNVEGHSVRGKVCTSCGERFFRMEDLLPLDAEIQGRQQGRKLIPAKDSVLLLAGTYENIPIPGRLVFQKEVFLLEKSFAPDHGLHIESFAFRPFRLGPYSRKLTQVLIALEEGGIIESFPLPGREGTAYRLTRSGKRVAARKSREVPPKVWSDLRKKRRAWDELGSRGLLRLVYQDFSAYAGKSEIRDQVEGNTWDEA